MKRILLEEQVIEGTIRKIPADSFTVLDFCRVLQDTFPKHWARLKAQSGDTGERRRYTVKTYLSNRLDVYSQKPHSLILPFSRYSEAGFKDYRRPTEDERKVFRGPWIAVFRKK